MAPSERSTAPSLDGAPGERSEQRRSPEQIQFERVLSTLSPEQQLQFLAPPRPVEGFPQALSPNPAHQVALGGAPEGAAVQMMAYDLPVQFGKNKKKGKEKEPAPKKRGDHLFNHGLTKEGRKLTATLAEHDLPSGAVSALTSAFSSLSGSFDIDAFKITVNKPPDKDDDANAVAFGVAIDEFRGAMEVFLGKLASKADQAALKAAGAAVKTKWQAALDAAYDAECEPYLSKSQKAKIGEGKAALAAAAGTLGGAIDSAIAAAKSASE